MKKILILALSFIFLIACDETPVNTDAILLNRTDVESNPGFPGFTTEHQLYSPKTDLVNSISSDFGDDEKLVIFVKPACTCIGTQKDFPHILKSLDEADIVYSKYEVYSIGKVEYNHPYSDIIQLSDIPAAFVIKNEVPTYSIFDSLNTYRGSDEANPNLDLVEYYLSDGLKN